MAQEHFLMGVYWLNHKVTAGQYINLVHNFFVKLKRFSLDFDKVKIVGRQTQVMEISSSFNEFEQALLPLLQKNDNWYRDSAGKKSTLIHKDYFSDAGFYNEFVFEKNGEAILITITAGNYAENEETKIVNNVLIEFPENDPKYKELVFVKKIFQLTIQHWNPAVGWLISKEFRRKVNNNANTFIGWLNYFTNKRIEDFIADEIIKENFHDGIITVLSDQVPSAEDPAALNKAINFRDILSKNNLLNWR